jgi:hypothetical protein
MAIEMILKKNKETPGTNRFTDVAATDHALTIYLTKATCKENGITEMIKVVITPAQ